SAPSAADTPDRSRAPKRPFDFSRARSEQDAGLDVGAARVAVGADAGAQDYEVRRRFARRDVEIDPALRAFEIDSFALRERGDSVEDARRADVDRFSRRQE